MSRMVWNIVGMQDWGRSSSYQLGSRNFKLCVTSSRASLVRINDGVPTPEMIAWNLKIPIEDHAR